MSKYTTEVRFICEREYENTHHGYGKIEDILDECWNKVFNFDFPIFDESYREILCKKILRHYYTHEIGEETEGLWKLRLQSTLDEVMPKFNMMYSTQAQIVKPLQNFDTITSRNGNSTRNVVGSNSGTKTRTGGYTDVKSGSVSTDHTGSEEKTITGSYSDERNVSGKETTSQEVTSGNLTNTTIDLFSDTPNGSIGNMGDNYASGSSDVPIVGEDTSYLTTAEKTINTQNDTRKIKNTKEYEGASAGEDYSDKRTRSYEDYSEKNERDGLNDTTTYNDVTNQRTYNSQTDTESGSDNRQTTIGEAWLQGVSGFKGATQSEMYQKFKDAIDNIDLMVINSLKDCFMLLW